MARYGKAFKDRAEARAAITDLELRMTIKTLAAKGQSQRAIARQLDMCEGTVRYHLRQIAAGAVDSPRTRRRAGAYRCSPRAIPAR